MSFGENEVSPTSEDRFWSKVDKSGDCWLWTGAVKSEEFPYGIFKLEGKTVRAHRYSWELAERRKPRRLCVLHRCDNPRCVRPNHLFLGTRDDNIQDCIGKGRFNPGHVLGERVGTSKLTEAKVRMIRQQRKSGVTLTQLGRDFGLDPSHVYRIVSRRSWKHVTRRKKGVEEED